VIRGFTTRVDAQRVGLPVSAIIEFRPNTMSDNEAAQFMRRFPQVRDCYRVTGTALLVAIVRVADNEGLRSLLGELYKHGETRTSVILTTEFEQRPVFAGKDEPSIGG